MNPMKCKCGKMIVRPKANKSGLCTACGLAESYRKRDSKNSHTINNASLGGISEKQKR